MQYTEQTPLYTLYSCVVLDGQIFSNEMNINAIKQTLLQLQTWLQYQPALFKILD